MAGPSKTDFWGVELTGKKKESIWDGGAKDEEDDPDIMHTLHIQRVILGPGAKDEPSLVSISAENCDGEEITHPLCWLSKKSLAESQCSLHLSLPPPVELKLVQGTGPVHVIGIHEQQIDELDMDDMDDDVSLESEENATLEPKPLAFKQLKRPATSPPAKPTKVARREVDNENGMSKAIKTGLLKKAAMVEEDSDEELEEDDEEDDMDEEDGDEDEELEEDSEEEEEVAPPKKKVVQKQSKMGTPKPKLVANTPKSIGDKAKKPKPNKDKGTPVAVASSLEELKARLNKSPNIPKKKDKFNNYLQNNLKITDPEMRNKLWLFVQQNKH